MITVEIVFATAEKQVIKQVLIESDVTILEAIALSRISDDFPGFDLLSMPYGIYGKKVDNTYVLRNGDRIEIYRPLVKTPNQRRLERASKGEKK